MGLVGGAWKVRQVTKSVPTLLVGTAMSAVTLTLVCDDVRCDGEATHKNGA